MPIGSGLRLGGGVRTRSSTKKSFPDIRTSQQPQGRFSGLLQGIQTAMYQGQVNQQNQMNQSLLGLKSQELGIKRKAATLKDDKSWISVLNNANRQITSLNKEIAKANANSKIPQALIPYMSLNEIMESGGKININQNMPVGGGLVPQQNAWGKIGGTIKTGLGMARKAVMGFAEGGIVNRPQMAMVGEQGKEYIVPQDKLDPATQAKLEGILGAPGGERGSNGQPGAKTGISTEDLIATLEDYGPDDVDQAIEDLIALDQAVNQPGLQLPDTVDYEAFAQAFIQKFGEETFRRLEARANELS